MIIGKSKHRLPKVLLAIFFIAIFCVLVLEGGLRAYVAIVNSSKSTTTVQKIDESTLDSYEMVDPQNNGTWVLRPGYKVTVSDLIEEKRQQGKELGAALIEETAQKYGYRSDDILFQINKFGFKGPDMQKVKAPGTLRIMTIGDSCTFGFSYDRYSYPRMLEQYLWSQGASIEVINAGVEGYSTTHVLYHLDYFMGFQPDIATIYVGWNDLYGDTFSERPSVLYIVRAIHRVYSYFFPSSPDWQVEGGRLSFSDHYYDSSTEEALRYASSYEPSFLPQVREILKRLSERGIKPVLVTLPGLFSIERQPTEEALRIGHLPGDVKNAYVLAAMTHKYNNAIRLIATEEKVPLIDLEEWGNRTLLPPEQWFVDSVHLTVEGQSAIGNYIAERLVELEVVSLPR